MPHDRMLATRNSYTWIHKYIFPGGLCLSVPAIERAVAAHTRLRIDDAPRTRPALRDDAAAVARTVPGRVAAASAELGFDETFRRMWEFYLAYSEAGFRGEYLDVWQFGMVKPGR